MVKHELIGLQVEVPQTKLKGKVIDETKNMLVIKKDNEIKKIPKHNTTFIFTLPSGVKVKVSGDLLRKRPEDRIKIKIKKW